MSKESTYLNALHGFRPLKREYRATCGGIRCLWIGAQTADTGYDWLKQQKCFKAVLAFVFGSNKTLLFLFCFSFISIVRTALALFYSRPP